MEKSETISINKVEKWAADLLQLSENELTKGEKKEQLKYAILIRNPNDKVFLSKLLDESSQIRDQKKLARRIKVLIDKYGVPEFFNASDSFLLKAYKSFGYNFDSIAVPIFKKRLRSDTAKVIIDEKRPNLTKHLENRYSNKIGQNVNLLGEVVVGDGEAQKRFDHYVEALSQPDINYISIKISGIYAQLHPLNYKVAHAELVERLSIIYRAAMDNTVPGEDGLMTPKFVNLDMEEYKDLHLTLEVFRDTLSKEEFKHLSAGIVVQAYLPDAEWLLGELLDFAHRRVADGGAPLKVRIVKGANLQMESVISSLRGWDNPVRSSKVDADAGHLRMMDIALRPENAKVLHVGIASHNLFTIGYAYLTATRNDVMNYVTFEMLEGMANNLFRSVSKLGANVILYTPVVKDEHFLNAVSYLVRRLDENTGPENFLSYSFNLKADSKEWKFLSLQFEEAFAKKNTISSTPTRTQNRLTEPAARENYEAFENEPDTNFDLKPNREWAEGIIAKWMHPERVIITLQVGDNELVTEKRYIYNDRMQEGVVSYEMSLANSEQIEKIIEIAKADSEGWASRNSSERYEILHRAGENIARRRADLIGAMCSVTSKTVTEGDVEVSEAIDFCHFYPHSMSELERVPDMSYSPQGVVVVISPWNFPLAIPVGGITAALSSGNRVILKPATVAAPIMWEAAKCFWEAGVPKDALQVVITDGREPLSLLTNSQDVSHIVLTGGTDTAQMIAKANPKVKLSAETGGKNAIILTSSGDRDKAIMNAVASAFGNAGQKCSACSLFLVEAEIFDSEDFKEKLKDCTESLKVGSPWNLSTVVGPMITNNNDKLLQSVNNPENKAKWLIEPEFLDGGQYVMRPAILWNVKPEDFEFKTELFAPLLSVVRFNGLDEAINMVNSLDYGLTSGLQSLDEGEISKWKDSLVAGNLYINRGITGAIVNRQPFGGMKLSAFGGGIKAGGSNYVSCFVNSECTTKVDDYADAFNSYFAKALDVNNLYGEQNVLRYLPLKKMVLRVEAQDKLEDIALVVKAARIAGTSLTVSVDATNENISALKELNAHIRTQNLWEFVAKMSDYERVRTLCSDVPKEIYEAAAAFNIYIASSPVVARGRVELLNYLQEQSISYEYHRYGSITEVPEI
ncbi:MAG: bifunctional proline dehydrogenase/L-glutamate gamma-semialdehyde dehydrogenase [Rikenellaceae bacterium]